MFDGLLQRVQQTFGCQALITTAVDKIKVLQRLKEGQDVNYPYIFLNLQGMSQNKESYATNAMARRGLMAVIASDHNQGRTVRLIPTNFDFELEFVTNRYSGVDQGSITAFSKRWLFAARCGYLKFSIDYGRLKINVSTTLGDQISIPSQENRLESESSYKLTTTLTVHGYVSESELGTQGVVQHLEVDATLQGTDGYQFFPFEE